MKPPKSLLIGEVNTNGINGRSKRKRGAFGEPVDDTFRNYMSRKIELQRRQFGQHVPPPPPPASPSLPSQSPPRPIASSGTQQYSSKNQSDDHLLHQRGRNRFKSNPKTHEKCDKSNITIPQFSSNSKPALQFSPHSSPLRATSVRADKKCGDRGEADSSGNEGLPSSSSAPLHFQGTNNSEDSALSLSQILIQLKRRHGNERTSFKQGSRGRKTPIKRKPTPEADNLAVPLKTSPHCRGIQNPHDSGGSFTPPDGCNSVLGILKNLERRHGDSSSFSYRKKLRKSSKSQVTFSPIIDKYSRSLEGNDGDFISTNRKKRKFSKSVLENLQSLQEREGDGNFSSDTATPCNSTFYSFDGKLAANKSPIIGVCTTWQSSPDQYSSRSQHGLNENGRLSDLLTDATQQFNDRALGETTLAGEGEQGMEESKLNIHPSSIRCQQQPQQPTKSPRAPKKLQTNHMSQNSLIPILPSQSTLSEQHNNFAQTTITAKSTSTSATNSSNRRSTHNITKLRPDLFFTGIIVLINGYTNPDGTTLLRLLQKHNGDVEKYETSRVTHIIAQQLSTAKVNIYKKQRKPIPVVKPDWIVESVKAGRLLDCREYLIDDVNENRHNTRSVKSFFGVENNLAMKKAAENLSDRGRDKPTSFKNLSDSDDVSLLNDSRSNDECMSATPAKESQDASNEYNGKTLHKINDTSNPSTLNGQVKAQTNSSLNINQTPYLLQASLSPKNDSKNESNRWNDKPPSKSHYHVTGQVRTVGNDPNFLESYFSNSRLSYIGSFKQRIKTNSVNSSTSHSKFGSKRFVLLVDMDCFFANVALRKFPQYRDKPVAVGHSSTDKSCPQEFASRSRNSSSELSTCNYIARKFGLRKGMFLGDAIQLCPDLVVLPYDFESFEEVSAVVAEVLHEYAGKYNGCVEVVSCDEAYIEIYVEPENYTGNDIYGFLYSIAEEIRKDIFKHTECTASVGVGQNKLLAKLGADRVKPNACCVVKDWRHFLDGLSLRKIPGVGYKFQKKLECRGITDVNNIWDLGDEAEKVVGEILGHGNARKIVKYCHGEDSRPVTPGPRKSIGAECNYGVRFNGPYGVDYMIMGLAKEVEKRMAAAGVRGSKMTLKVMQSKDATKMPGKFLGHGSCVSLSKSSDIPLTRNCDMIAKTGMKLFERLDIEKDLVRGMGIVICSLKTDTFEPATSYTTKLAEWLKRDEVMMKPGMDFSTDEPKATANKKLEGEQRKFNQPVSEGSNEDKAMNTLPSFSQLDGGILRELPRDILHEVKSTYRSVANNYKASERLQLTDSPLTNSGNVFDIPSLSQIDLDEVMELPPDICHAILEQIGKTNEGTNSAAVDTAISQKGPKRPTIRKVDRTIPIAGQVSVKRMMKLVNIKSGEESLPAFRLSQLDSLPLETQLQIVNDDDVAITKQVKKPSKSTEKSEVDLNEDSTVEDTFKKGIQHDQPKPTESFYVDNILPLKEFIISRPYPKSDDVKLVKDFLYLFVKKYQYDDTVAFLRAIKTMQNGWDESVYVKIRDEIVGNIFALSGNRLDVRRLRL